MMKTGYMKLKPNQIKLLREQKAWSQSHLAEVSGLSLRTIQRIEKEGSASQESVQALASVFETNASELLIANKVKKSPLLFPASAIAAVIAFVVAYAWSSSSVAENLVLDFSASYRLLGSDTREENLLTIDGAIHLKENETTRLKLNDLISYEISVSFLEDDKILILSHIFDEGVGKGNLVGSPKIITLNHKEAIIEVGDEKLGKVYSIRVTPHK